MNQFTHIDIKGARTNNLKNIDLKIKIGSITCFYGPSGSGKSTLAFHTLLTESKRRFMNSFPSDVKFFWDLPNVVDVDSINPVLPVWGLAQNNPIIGSRPAVADIIGLSDQVQKIFYLAGKNTCPDHEVEYVEKGIEQRLQSLLEDSSEEVYHCFIAKNDYQKVVSSHVLPSRSVDADLTELRDFNSEDYYFELFRFKKSKMDKVSKSFKELNLTEFRGNFLIVSKSLAESFYLPVKSNRVCPECDSEEVEVKSYEYFSPYNALGACDNCQGHGMTLEYDIKKLIKDPSLSVREDGVSFLTNKRLSMENSRLKNEMKKAGLDLDTPIEKLPKAFMTLLYNGKGSYCGFNELFDYLESKRYKRSVRIFLRSIQTERVCTVCNGTRVNQNVLNVLLNDLSYENLLSMNLGEAYISLLELKSNLSKSDLWPKYKSSYENAVLILEKANHLGLSHLPLTKKARTISTGEYQRLLLVKYLSYSGNGSLFVLDEPSLGLTKNEQEALWKCLVDLKEQGNTIILVDHSEYLQKMSDEVILMGPGAGNEGGEVVYQGKFKKSKFNDLPQDLYDKKRKGSLEFKELTIEDHALKNIKLPLNQLTLVKGGTGSIKTKLLIEGLANLLSYEIKGEKLFFNDAKVKGLQYPMDTLDVFSFGTSPLRSSSRSSVGTMIGVTPILRKHFADLPVSKSMGLLAGNFSPNSDLGKCTSCDGKGTKVIDMQFLEDLEFTCEDCKGMKLKPLYATIHDGNFSVHESFSLPMNRVLPQVRMTPKMKRIWEYIKILNLDYLSLDRELSSLSGGEGQRLKLLSAMQKEISNSVLFFENLSFGLSKKEMAKIVELLHRLLSMNNTIVLIDENEFFEDYAHKIMKM
ncbi:hypothetical protein HBN50_15850 [Halobacteriovorax sp. GB3]|uniref:hypothetical protein n=1 Tax=Halobacteriovorax sp. GB3 TaxID=2719615 RepID=UPI002362A512|nr:hypothetical protein [Halobacteriovorax sp. GB3]MDD0854586.1 hypothetical protein [Halobacteriovorax sp. GB3]